MVCSSTRWQYSTVSYVFVGFFFPKVLGIKKLTLHISEYSGRAWHQSMHSLLLTGMYTLNHNCNCLKAIILQHLVLRTICVVIRWPTDRWKARQDQIFKDLSRCGSIWKNIIGVSYRCLTCNSHATFNVSFVHMWYTLCICVFVYIKNIYK